MPDFYLVRGRSRKNPDSPVVFVSSKADPARNLTLYRREAAGLTQLEAHNAREEVSHRYKERVWRVVSVTVVEKKKDAQSE